MIDGAIRHALDAEVFRAGGDPLVVLLHLLPGVLLYVRRRRERCGLRAREAKPRGSAQGANAYVNDAFDESERTLCIQVNSSVGDVDLEVVEQ